MTPIAWQCEIASSLIGGKYAGWRRQILNHVPICPEGAVRNLQPLYPLPDEHILRAAIARKLKLFKLQALSDSFAAGGAVRERISLDEAVDSIMELLA